MFNPDSRFRNFLNKDSPKIEGIYPDMSNSELWEDYCDKARRFSAEKWNNLLGISSKNIPELMDAGEWTTRDYLVIGEFIRWYHHRFALENFGLSNIKNELHLSKRGAFLCLLDKSNLYLYA